MIETKVYGFQCEGRTLCPKCAERIFGTSLPMYVNAENIQMLLDKDRTSYAQKGLVCDECFSWIFQPDPVENPWWRVDPDADEHLRLLAPFADFLVTLKVDTINLRNLSI